MLWCAAVGYFHRTHTVNAALARQGYQPECCRVLQWGILTTQTQLMLHLLDRDTNRRVAVCCSMLQCVVLCCSHVSMGCSVMQYVAVCCAVLRSHINGLQCNAVCCSVLCCVVVAYSHHTHTVDAALARQGCQHTATHCNPLQHTAIHCNTHSPHTYT